MRFRGYILPVFSVLERFEAKLGANLHLPRLRKIHKNVQKHIFESFFFKVSELLKTFINDISDAF